MTSTDIPSLGSIAMAVDLNPTLLRQVEVACALSRLTMDRFMNVVRQVWALAKSELILSEMIVRLAVISDLAARNGFGTLNGPAAYEVVSIFADPLSEKRARELWRYGYT